MSFTGKLESAYRAFNGPNQEELFSESKKLNDKIDNKSPLQKSITKLIQKIENSNTSEERYILEEQLKQLEKINKLYLESIKSNITKTTKTEIQSLLLWLEFQINSKENILEDDYETLENIIKTENEKLEDTIDIISENTIRDLVENNINILWIRESIPKEQYQKFFDIATVTYIDLLEEIENSNTSFNQNQIDFLIKNKWLYLDSNWIHKFIFKLIPRLDNQNLNFDFEIKLHKQKYNKIFIVNLKQYKEKIEKYDLEIERKKQLKQEIENEKNRIKIFENNIEQLSTKERMDYIDKLLNKEEFEKYLNILLEELKWETIYLRNNKRITFTEKFIKKNKEKLLHNIKILVLLIIEIESNWNPKAKNWISSAEWLWQWLSWNWRISNEHIYDYKWRKTKQIKNVRLTSSFETALRLIKNKFWKKIWHELNFINQDYNHKTKLKPRDLNLREQIKILMLHLWSNNKISHNWNWIMKFIWTAMTWNIRAIKEIYRIFHHTAPNRKTEKRIHLISQKYISKLQKL